MNPLSGSLTQDDKSGLRILVVEDNRDTRYMVGELLSLLGHQPLGVGNAEQALAAAGANAFDILFTDINLPGMSGIRLAQQIAIDHPGLRIILASGYHVEKKDLQGFSCEILLKPYDLEQLQAALHNLPR